MTDALGLLLLQEIGKLTLTSKEIATITAPGLYPIPNS
jgi:hypothetical protein